MSISMNPPPKPKGLLNVAFRPQEVERDKPVVIQ